MAASAAGGAFTNNTESISEAGVVVNNAITFTVSNTAALVKTFTNSYSGQQLLIRVWVKLGTATNFALVINNQLSWNSVGGKCFTSSDGLNTSTYTLCQLVFTLPSSVLLGINLGGNLQSITAQTTGTVFAYGWKILYNNSTEAIPTFTPTNVIAWTALGSATVLDNQVDAIVPNNTVSRLTLDNAWNL